MLFAADSGNIADPDMGLPRLADVPIKSQYASENRRAVSSVKKKKVIAEAQDDLTGLVVECLCQQGLVFLLVIGWRSEGSGGGDIGGLKAVDGARVKTGRDS